MTFPAGFLLRHATAADLPAYGAFVRLTFQATYGPQQEPESLARHVAERLNDDRLQDELHDASRTLLLLESGTSLAGFALLRAWEAPPEVGAANAVEVERFYVGQAWHGRGLAAPLMTAALDVARAAGHDAAWLSVWERNPRAIRFYEKQGFAIVGRHVYYFDGQPEDDHLMVRALLDPAPGR
ncbi:MAG: GNAT family N-acetyltransferase [Gemmatimonadaceae bacterium]